MTECFFVFNDTATTEIYTLSLHDALPIFRVARPPHALDGRSRPRAGQGQGRPDQGVRLGGSDRGGRPQRRDQDRKSTRLNSSHANISYAVFCLKKINIYTHVIPTNLLIDL